MEVIRTPAQKQGLASRPPMSIRIPTNDSENACYLKDFDGRRFKTIIPQSGGRECVGLTCGYLILFGRGTKDFWLVNPITSHQLHFPDVPFPDSYMKVAVRGILVFSPSISDWVFVVVPLFSHTILFCVAGKREWNHVSSTDPVVDLHAFKGKIYTLNPHRLICEMRLSPQPKLTLVKKDYFWKEPNLTPTFASSRGNLYVSDSLYGDSYVCELEVGKMK